MGVYVSRTGECMWVAGMYRLCISQLVGVDAISVHVRLRHEGWQRYRDAVYNGPVEPSTHPDLHDLR